MPRSSPIYYFFHLIGRKGKYDRYEYMLEQRKNLKSDITCKKNEEAKNLILIGGIKLYKKYSNNRTFVCIQPI